MLNGQEYCQEVCGNKEIMVNVATVWSEIYYTGAEVECGDSVYF